jgi:hypothetical protein
LSILASRKCPTVLEFLRSGGVFSRRFLEVEKEGGVTGGCDRAALEAGKEEEEL